MMALKLGLKAFEPETDEGLFNELLAILPLLETDMTIFYRELSRVPVEGTSLDEVGPETLMAPLMDSYYVRDQLTSDHQSRICKWLRRYIERVRKDGTPDPLRRQRMNAVNPKYVLRNYMAQHAIDKAEQGDFALVDELLELLRHPYDEQPGKEEFAKKRPDWARHRAGCSMLSCSS